VSALNFVEKIMEYVTLTTAFPIVTLFFLLMFFSHYIKSLRPRPGTTEWILMEVSKKKLTFLSERYKLEKSDIAPLLIITVLFTALALFRLGDTTAPQSFFQFTNERREVLIELDEPEEIGALMFYPGLRTGQYTLEFSEDGVNWLEQNARETFAMNQSHANLFKWRLATLNNDNPPVKYIRLTASRTPIELGELALVTPKAENIPLSRISTSAHELFDEQIIIPSRPTHMNSMYFDEIYHGRTALEYLRGVEPYETTHPPLGKTIIAGSIFLLGMTPFGWRLCGAVFGVLILIIMYIFIKNMFGRTAVAVCGTLLLGFDFMRFVQTRIATIDTYGVFFILLAYFFMYRHITTPPDARFRRSLPPLALSGICFGLGCASKWIVIYAGVGLAVIYFIRLIHLRKHYKGAEARGFGAYLTKTLLFSVLFFIVVPVVIYCLSYIPFVLAKGLTISAETLATPAFYHEYFRIVWENQILMYTYHGGLEATHPFSSAWWQWIINAKPVLYVNSYFGETRASFAAFGNPAVWWGGFAAMIFMVYRVIKYRDGKALFILIGYLSQLVPWIPVSRIVFIYHYFPSTLFIVLALAHMFNTILERRKGSYKIAVYGYAAGAGVLFALFYPALSGMFVQRWYFSTLLQWIPEHWPFK